MHQALYRKWRPQTFDDVCGQEHITSILRYEADNHAFSHAYLFCGSRGTGKTTCAKILAKVINCESPVNGNPCGKCKACQTIEGGATTDILEMDAASNNGVENIRDIRDEVVYSPSSLRYRVYIIDEVHMLSISAFNALLKTLEEPPEHVVFILATTELQKLPATIISRCQRFDFRRISTEVLMNRLLYIAEKEQIKLEPDAARALAKLAQGGMRDAISLLELCAGARREVTIQTVEESVGLTGRDAMLKTVNAITARDYDTLFSQIDEVVRSSKDISIFWQDLISLYRDMLVIKTTASASSYLDLTDHETAQISDAVKSFTKEKLLYHCRLLEDSFFSMQKANAVKRMIAELTLIRMCDEALDNSTEAILSRVAQLEEQIASGNIRVAPVSAPSVNQTDKPPVEVTPKQSANISNPSAKTTTTTASTSEKSDKRILRPIRSWMEVAERVGRSAPMTASFIKNSRAFTTEEGRVIVRFENDFALHMLEQGSSKDHLRSAVSAVLRREVQDRDLIFEVVGKREEGSPIDEILEALD